MKKNDNLRLFVIVMLTLSTFLSSCSSDDNEPGNYQNSSALLDKWWYDSEDFTADVYFHADGEYQQKINLSGNILNGSGDWVWENESAGIMKVNLSGSGQLASHAWYKISDLTEHSVTIQQSTDGTSYSQEVHFVDSDD